MTDDVRYPTLRLDVLAAIEALADPEYQRRVWRDGQLPQDGTYEGFDMAIHTLYDDMELDDGAIDAVGDVLRNESEAQAIDDVIAALEAVFTALGGADVSSRALDTPTWPAVVDAAKAARAAMTAM